MPAQYILRKSTNNQFYFSLTAANNEKILASEQYTSKSGALQGIESVKTNAQTEARFDRQTSADGKYYFRLKAANGEVIGTSELYNTQQARENGIKAVKTAAPSASLSDQT